jgi:hypothetical protein
LIATLNSGDVPVLVQLFNAARRRGRFCVESASEFAFVRTIRGPRSGLHRARQSNLGQFAGNRTTAQIVRVAEKDAAYLRNVAVKCGIAHLLPADTISIRHQCNSIQGKKADSLRR